MDFSSDPDDEFARIRERRCAACGAAAKCQRITTRQGLAKTYDFKCAGCSRTFSTSGLFSLILFAVIGLFLMVLAVPLGMGQSKGMQPGAEAMLYGAGAALVGLGCLAFAGFRVRTARQNPELAA